MFLYAVLPYLHVQNAFNASDLPSVSTDHLESIWTQVNMMSFIVYGLDSYKFYYFLLPYLIDNNESYWRINEKEDLYMSHFEVYALEMIQQVVQRLQRRLQTRSALKEMIEHLDSDEEFLVKLKQLDKEMLFDMELIERTIKETEERVEIDRAYRPGGVGYRQAQDDFLRKIASLESVCLV
jgi:hypothetical protein